MDLHQNAQPSIGAARGEGKNAASAKPNVESAANEPDLAGVYLDGEAASPDACLRMRLEWFDESADLALSDPDEPLIEDMLDEGTLSVVYGDSNAGKTFTMLDIAFAPASGRAWNGKRCKRGLVIYVCAEGGRRIRRRAAALRKRKCNHSERPLFALVRYSIDLRSSDADAKELLSLIREAERRCGARCVWIIVDTLSRAMAGGDENSPVDMGRIVQSADLIREKTGAHFTYVHHTGKDAAKGARGHSLLRAATDTEIEVTRGAIKVTKQRDMESGAEFRFSLIDVTLGEDSNGRTIKSAVVEWSAAQALETTERGKATIPQAQRLLMDVILEAIKDKGEEFRPSDNGRAVRAVNDEIVRKRYFARIAETPKEDDTPDKLAERQKKAFNRGVKAMLDAKRLAASQRDKDRLLWVT